MSHDREAVWAVVTPVYEDGQSFASLCRDLARLDTGATLEILAVDDGSIDAPPAVGAIEEAGLAGRIVRLKRNGGHQTAIWVGLAVAASEPRYAGAAVMDSDGEDRPADLPQLLAAVDALHHDGFEGPRVRTVETPNRQKHQRFAVPLFRYFDVHRLITCTSG